MSSRTEYNFFSLDEDEWEVTLAMMGEEASEETETRKGRVSTLPSHLTTPLLTTRMTLLGMALKGEKEHPAIKARSSLSIQNKFWAHMRDLGVGPHTHVLTPGTAEDIVRLMQMRSPQKQFPPQGQEALQLYKEIIRVVDRRVQGYDEAPDKIVYSEQTEDAWAWYRALQIPYDRLRRDFPVVDQGRVKACFDNGYSIYLASAGLVVETGPDAAWYGPLEWFLSALAGSEGLAMACVSLDVVRNPLIPRVTPLVVHRVAEFQRSLILEYGNWGYPVAKGPEALWKTWASRISGGSLGEEDAFFRMILKYEEKEAAAAGLHGVKNKELVRDFVRLFPQIKEPDEAVELSGILHMVGYPILDPTTSAAKSRRLGCAPETVEISAALDARCIFLHLVCQTHIMKHGRWPPIDFFGGRDSVLARLATSGALNFTDKSYPLRDWDGAQIGQIEDLDPMIDWTSLMNDKSTCAGLAAREDHYRGVLGGSTSRRFLAHLLAEKEIDVLREMRSLASGDIAADDFAADQDLKGLEYKYEGRAFTILPPRIRRGLSAIQENVKDKILPYVPKTSMAMSGQEVEHTLHKMTSSTGSIPILKVEADLSSWNLCFKQGFTAVMSRAMSPLVGVPGIFGASHDYFFKSEFMISSPGCSVPQMDGKIPRTEDSDTMWRGDGSGKEGIEQRFWTVLTSCMFTLALWDTPYQAQLLGQGDNQVLVIPMIGVKKEDLEGEAGKIMRLIESTCTQFGHTAKPEEFMESMTMLTYGKAPHIHGSKVPVTTKFGMKVVDSDSEFTQSLEGAIGSISSAGLSAARNSVIPLRLFLLSSIKIEEFLIAASEGRTWLGRDYDSMCEVFRNADAIGWALIATAQVGGFPIVPWTSYLYSGAPDPLSDVLSSILHLNRYAPADNIRRWLLLDSSYRKNPSLSSLISDPFGLPLQLPVTATSVLRDAARGILMSCNNLAVSELARASCMGGEAALVKALTQVRPFYPVMARDMLEISAAGRAAKVAAAFDTSSTLIKMAATPNLIGKYQEASFRRSAATTAIAYSVTLQYHGPALCGSGYSAATLLRERWNVEGGIAGIACACPLDYEVSTSGPGIALVVAPFPHCDPPPSIPYLGSKTQEKRSVEKYTVLRTTGLQDLKKLVLSYTAGAIDENLAVLYRDIAATRTPLSLAQLVELLPRTIGGTPAHRYDSMRNGAIMAPVGNPREGGWVQINTDNIPGVSASSDDWPIPMQMHMSFLVSMVRCAISQGSRRREYWLRVSTDGLDRIEDTPRQLPDPPPPLDMVVVGNPLCWVPSLEARSASTRVGGTREAPPHLPTIVTGRRLAAGLIADALLAPKSRGLASEVGGAPHIEVDTLANANLGGRNIFRAASVAVAMATVWHTVTRTGNVDNRFVIGRLIDNLSSALMPFLWSALSPEAVSKRELEEDGIWAPSGGRGGVVALKGVLLAQLRGGARNCLYSWELFREEIVLPETSVHHPPYFSLLWPMAQAIWVEHISEGVFLGPLKLAMVAVLKSMREAKVPEDVSGRGVEAAMYRLRLIANAMGGEAGSYITRIRTMQGSSLDLWRVLRRVPRDPLPAARPEEDYYEDGDEGVTTFTKASEEVYPLRLILTADTPSALTEAMKMDDRSQRPGRGGSTVGELWFPHIRRIGQGMKSELVGVVGTGRGGIQKVLESRGIRSQGLDLADTIPNEVMADPTWTPPECTSLGTYSPLMRSTSGDWFDPEVSGSFLAQGGFRWVIIDIESGRMRHGMELIIPLFQAGYSGWFSVKMLLTDVELSTAYSILLATKKVVSLRASPLVEETDGLDPNGVIPIIISGKIVPGATALASKGRVLTVKKHYGCEYPVLTEQAIPKATRDVVSRLTGGHIVASNLRDALEVGKLIYREASGGRGSTQGGSILSVCRGVQAVHEVIIMKQLGVENYSDALRLVGPPGDLDFGFVRLPRDDKTMKYIRKKIMPRLWRLADEPIPSSPTDE